jgi:hypothetical protein
MHATSSDGIRSTEPQAGFGISNMPGELLVHIVLRIRDSASMRSFAQTCSHLARLSRAPAFVHAMTECIFREQCALLDMLPMPDCSTGIFQLARRMAERMQPSHFEQMMACLDFEDEEESGSEDGSATEAETGRISTSALLPASIAAAICSGKVEGFNEEVKQHAAELVDRMPWKRVAESQKTLPLPTRTDAEIALFIDALSGIWGRMWTGNAQSVNKATKCSVAAFALSSVAALPMKHKLPLLKAIVQSDLMQSDPLTRFIICIFLDRSASHAETLDVPLAEELFGLLGTVIDDVIASSSTMSDAHLLFAKMLPPLPWRKNSRRALDWLMKALPRVRNGLSRQTIKQAIPAGIFNEKEITYLARSLLEGSFSWSALKRLKRSEPAACMLG